MAEKQEVTKLEPIRTPGDYDYVGAVGIKHPTNDNIRFKVITPGPPSLEPQAIADFFQSQYGMDMGAVIHKCLANLSTAPNYVGTVTDSDGKLLVTDPAEIHQKFQEAMDNYKPGQREPGKTAVVKAKAAKADALEAKLAEAGIEGGVASLMDLSPAELKKLVAARKK